MRQAKPTVGILTRISPKLHKQFREYCGSTSTSMNKEIRRFIRRTVRQQQRA